MTSVVLDLTQPDTDSKNWLSTKETESYLNVHRRMLYKQKKVDRLKSDVHYRILNPDAERPTYQWNAGAIESCMQEALDDLLAHD